MFTFDSATPPSAFARCLRHEPTVRQTLATGGSLEDVVVALCEAKEELTARVFELEALTPKNYVAPTPAAFRPSAEHLI